MALDIDDLVQVHLTAAGLPQWTSGLVPAGLRVEEAIAEIASRPAGDAETRRVLQAVERELSAEHWEVFGRAADGATELVDRSTAVAAVATERPISPHRADAPTSLLMAELEVIAQARVG